MRRQIGLVLITFEKLEELLGLPEGHIVRDIVYRDIDKTRNSFLVKISGPKVPISKEGQELMLIPLSDLIE